MLKVRYKNFWPGFNASEGFFNRLLEFVGVENEIVTNRFTDVDLEFTSVFPSRRELLQRKAEQFLLRKGVPTEGALRNVQIIENLKQGKATKSIWFTGENIRPPYNKEIGLTLSYDQDPFNDTNMYFPLWYTHLDWFGKPEFNFRVGLDVEQRTLLSPRTLSKADSKLACVFFKNPHPMRLRAVAELEKYGTVDVFGNTSKNVVQYKREVARDYRYMLCFENDFYPGYVTEKLLDAYLAGCVPIYWGHLGTNEYINEKCFISVADGESLGEVCHSLASLDQDDYEKIASEPFLKKELEFQVVFNSLIQFLVS